MGLSFRVIYEKLVVASVSCVSASLQLLKEFVI